MVLLFADDVEIDLVHAVLPFFEGIHDDRRPVRNFLFVFEQDFFPHDLGDHKLFAAIGDDVFGEERLPLGQERENRLAEGAQIFPLPRRNGIDIRLHPRLAERGDVGGNVFLRHDVDLRIGDEERDPKREVLLHQGNILLFQPRVPVVHE